jgi:uncharacterized membrane protein
VFAVAITLLVLNIKTPKAADLMAGHTSLTGALLAQWPSYLSYVLSFLTVLIIGKRTHHLIRLLVILVSPHIPRQGSG